MILYRVFINHSCKSNKWSYRYYSIFLIVFTFILSSSNRFSSHAAESVTFTDIALNHDTGISYRRIGFRNDAFLDSKTVFSANEVFNGSVVRLPPMYNEISGVAVFDFDNDTDLDLYVTNYRGAANSLYVNQLKESGEVTFIDVAVNAGVDATNQDSTGVCFGDIDNDNDEDLLVLGGITHNRLFENLGNGHFADITLKNQTGLGSDIASVCSIGDVNADGLLDLLIANSIELKDSGIVPVHNQLYLNQGDNIFMEVSKVSGIQNIAKVTWGIALVDYDQDGDVDIVTADDFDNFARIYKNDGNGVFTDVTVAVGTDRSGSWMGLAFGDLNSDGNMDIFNSNIGDYFMQGLFATPPGTTIEPGLHSSGWFLGQDDGTFIYPGTGALGVTPFGWGAAMTDYDNDGDTDIVYHGGMNMGVVTDATNPGAILKNDGAANFTRDARALTDSTDHTRRAVRGVATGDLNDDGFMDIVSVSSIDWPIDFPLVPIVVPELQGGQFDDVAYNWPQFTAIDPMDLSQGFTWNGNDPVDGTLSVEINSANNGNKWVKVKVLGGIGLTSNGRVNRDGIGAVITFTPKHGKPVMRPVIGGASHASADSLEAGFGLNTGGKGTVHVLWPGGVRNKLYEVRAGERIVFPEIPCSYADASLSRKMYKACVKQALDELVDAGRLSKKERAWFMSSALKAFTEQHARNNN